MLLIITFSISRRGNSADIDFDTYFRDGRVNVRLVNELMQTQTKIKNEYLPKYSTIEHI